MFGEDPEKKGPLIRVVIIGSGAEEELRYEEAFYIYIYLSAVELTAFQSL